MRLQKVQDALNKKNNKFEYTEEDVPWTEIPCMGIRGQRLGCRDQYLCGWKK